MYLEEGKEALFSSQYITGIIQYSICNESVKISDILLMSTLLGFSAVVIFFPPFHTVVETLYANPT